MRLPRPLLRNNPNVHKYSFGHVLIAAGSAPMLGAATLASLAAARAGAGMVTCAVPAKLNGVLQKKISPVVMTLPVPGIQPYFTPSAVSALSNFLRKCTAAAIGPGMGRNPATQRCILQFIEQCQLPLVIDADGLNALAGNLKVLKKRTAPAVLTPHDGEMARLAGKPCPQTPLARKRLVKAFAEEHGCVMVLKGPHSVVAAPGENEYVNRSGNAGMAKAGSGDVLTGIIAALLAQGVPAYQATCFGVHWHGKAGDAAARSIPKASMLAVDLIDHLPGVLKRLLQ